jgi:signal transduction histidine kinase|tara:strand:- start:919 stop:2259 length:1341 start_codon:yes stop_codon:yes gene_type:complete
MALFFTVLLSAAVLSLGYFLYDYGREEYQRESELVIDAEIENLLLELKLNTEESLKEIVDERAVEREGVFYLLVDSQSNWLAGDLRSIPDAVARIAEGVIRFKVDVGTGEKSDWRIVAAKIHTFPDQAQLLVARDVSVINERFLWQRTLSFLSIACLFSIVLVSFFISFFVVTRINRMSNIALEIVATGNLSKRLAVDSRWDDMSHLAGVFNQMLDRIESLMEGVKQVSDNIAHDLRTPLAHLRNRLEVMQQSDPESEEVAALIKESDRLLQTFGSLLRISKMDSEVDQSNFEKVDLQKIATDSVEFYRPMALEQNMELLFEGESCFIRGDRNLLFQAISNVIDNAIKYSPAGGQIRCVLVENQSTVEIAFADQGIGVSEKDKKRLLERFYRCDPSRSTSGTGLGLSLVDSIVRLHDGSIDFQDAHPNGLIVRLTLPRKSAKITQS